MLNPVHMQDQINNRVNDIMKANSRLFNDDALQNIVTGLIVLVFLLTSLS